VSEPMLSQEVQNCYQQAAMDQAQVAWRQMKWAVVLGARIYLDGDQWCVLHGDNMMTGIFGCGDTPEKAIEDFELAMRTAVPAQHPTGDTDATR